MTSNAFKITLFLKGLYRFLHNLDTIGIVEIPQALAAAEPASPRVDETEAAVRQDRFVRAELVRRLFQGSAPSRYFSFVLWPVIAAIYWRQIDLVELASPFVAYLAVTLGFDVLRHRFAQARPDDEQTLRWGWWFAGFTFLGACSWGSCCWPLSRRPCRSAPPTRRLSMPMPWPRRRRCFWS